MAVLSEAAVGSIGGGMLEYMAIQRARTLLEQGATRHRLISFPLGPDTQQCCGGVVTLFFEPVTETVARAMGELKSHLESGALIATCLGADRKQVFPTTDCRNDAWLEERDGQPWLIETAHRHRFTVALFGAGHVGSALVHALALQSCRVLWFDPRPEQFPQRLPVQVRTDARENPASAVPELPPGALVLVMTHRHPLDYEICRSALRRDDLGFVGLIGSASKRNRFAAQFRRDGLGEASIDRLVCPIGIPGIKGKEPPVIAASVVAQLLQVAERDQPAPEKRQGISEAEADATPVADVF